MISVTSRSPFQDSKGCSTFTCLYAVFVVIFVCLLASGNVGNLYPYGVHESDQELGVRYESRWSTISLQVLEITFFSYFRF